MLKTVERFDKQIEYGSRGLNRKIFKYMRTTLDEYQEELCTSKPELICPMANRAGTKRRNIHQIAIAPTMGISNLADLTSSGM